MKKMVLFVALALLVSQNAIYSSVIEKVTEERGYISTHSEKTKDVYPNIAEVTFTKETTAKNIETASLENKTAIAEINKALQVYKTKNSDSTEIRTGSYSASPNYSYKGNKKQIIGYTVVNSITVRTKSTELLGKMIDSAIKAGADRVGSLSFSFENDGTICRDLILQATKEAQELAKVAAGTTSQTIKGVKAINTSCYTQMNSTSNFRNFASAKSLMATDEAAGIPETTVSPGKIKVRASVNADFYVK